MPDWPEVVRAQMGPLDLDSRREAEIFAELADHLQDLYDDCRRQGLSEKQAVEQALASISDWAGLRRDIRSAERGGMMSHRWKSFWLPGSYALVMFFGLFFGLALIARLFRVNPAIAQIWRIRELVFAGLWLLMLAATGALAAYLSKRAGGGRSERILAALLLPGVFALMLPVGLLLRPPMGTRVFDDYIVTYVLYFVAIPAAALLLGALPLLKNHNRSHSFPGAAARRGS